MTSREPLNPPVGQVLRSVRLAHGLSQEELAARAKVHRNYVGMIERGERSPTFTSVARIIRVLDLTWADLGRALDESPGP